jgi:hypothetical protein
MASELKREARQQTIASTKDEFLDWSGRPAPTKPRR